MNTPLRFVGIAVALVAFALVPACSQPKGSVSSGELKSIRTAGENISPGQSKSEVFAQYKGANLVRLSTAKIDGANIEEWKAEAFSDSGKGRDLHVRFLYFRNEVLVDMSDTRIDFRNDAALTKRWAGGGN